MDILWFKEQQRRVGVTAADIADRLGKARSNVSNILNGRQRMNLEWAQAFADVLQVPLATVLEKAGVADPAQAQTMAPGYADSDVAPWVDGPGGREIMSMGQALGARDGVDIWRVRSAGMALGGYLPGDFLLVDTEAATRATPGDTVIARLYLRDQPRMVLRRWSPPVLIAAASPVDDVPALVVDGRNVVILGRVAASWRLTLAPPLV